MHHTMRTILAVAVAAMAMAGGATEPAAAVRGDGAIACGLQGHTPLWAPGGGRFAYISSQTGVNQIWIVDVPSCASTQVTSLGGGVAIFSWSPDGSRIAFSGRPGPSGEHDIYVVDAAGTGLRQCTNTPGTTEGFNHGAWLPDGDLLIGSEGSSSGFFNLYRLDPNACGPPGSPTVPMTCLTCSEGSQDNYAVPSRDGTRIAWFQGSFSQANLRLMDADGSNKGPACAAGQPHEYRGISWSRDQALIAFNVGGRRVRLISSACDGSVTEISNASFDEAMNDFNQNQAWFADDVSVAIHSNQNGNYDIFALGVTGGRVQLTSDPADDRNPVVSPAGDALAFECASPSGGTDVCLLPGGPLQVPIDVKPGSFPNSINLGSAGVVPVAILGTASFDAAQVDPDTVSLAGARVKMVGRGGRLLCHLEDVNSDGFQDMVCQVETAEFMIEEGESVAVLEAELLDGTAIRGEDSIQIVPAP